MNTDSHINIQGRHLVASLLAALASMIVPILFVTLFVLAEVFMPPENSENDGYIRGFAVFLGFIPLMFFAHFTFYIFISLKDKLTLKATFTLCFTVSLVIAAGFSWLLKGSLPILDMLFVGLSTSVSLGASLCVGGWVWHKKLSTQQAP